MYIHVHVYTCTCTSLSVRNIRLFLCAVDPSLFQRKEIVPRATRRSESSTLAELLAEYDKRSANPFFEYSRYNGDVSSHVACV